jgi:hypothetical protein
MARNVHNPLSVSLILARMLVADCIGVSYLLKSVRDRSKNQVNYQFSCYCLDTVMLIGNELHMFLSIELEKRILCNLTYE